MPIFFTEGVAALALPAEAVLFSMEAWTAMTQTIFWCVSFILASAGASSAYLTDSETFTNALSAVKQSR